MCSVVAVQLEHRLVLNSIGQSLGNQDLEEMLFICESFISESTAEDMVSPMALFRELEHRMLVGPGKYEFLKNMLSSIGRNDLASKLPLAKKKVSVPVAVRKASTTNRRSLLLVISDELRRKDIKKLLYLCSCQSSDGLSLIEDLEHKGLISPDNLDYLAQKLGEIGRCDLCKLLATKGHECGLTSRNVQEEIATW